MHTHPRLAGTNNHGDTPQVSMPLLLKPKDAAAMLAISPRKLWELTNTREVPCVRIGRCLRYPCEDLRAWVEKRKRAGSRNGQS